MDGFRRVLDEDEESQSPVSKEEFHRINQHVEQLQFTISSIIQQLSNSSPDPSNQQNPHQQLRSSASSSGGLHHSDLNSGIDLEEFDIARTLSRLMSHRTGLVTEFGPDPPIVQKVRQRCEAIDLAHPRPNNGLYSINLESSSSTFPAQGLSSYFSNTTASTTPLEIIECRLMEIIRNRLPTPQQSKTLLNVYRKEFHWLNCCVDIDKLDRELASIYKERESLLQSSPQQKSNTRGIESDVSQFKKLPNEIIDHNRQEGAQEDRKRTKRFRSDNSKKLDVIQEKLIRLAIYFAIFRIAIFKVGLEESIEVQLSCNETERLAVSRAWFEICLFSLKSADFEVNARLSSIKCLIILLETIYFDEPNHLYEDYNQMNELKVKMIQLAFECNLNRDPGANELRQQKEKQVEDHQAKGEEVDGQVYNIVERRMIWWSCLTIDGLLNEAIGKKSSIINLELVDVYLPALSDLVNDDIHEGCEEGCKVFSCYRGLKPRLCISFTAHEVSRLPLQRNPLPTLSEIEEIHGDLIKLESKELNQFFKLYPLDERSIDKNRICKCIKTQRESFFFYLRYHYLLVRLHRPLHLFQRNNQVQSGSSCGLIETSLRRHQSIVVDNALLLLDMRKIMKFTPNYTYGNVLALEVSFSLALDYLLDRNSYRSEVIKEELNDYVRFLRTSEVGLIRRGLNVLESVMYSWNERLPVGISSWFYVETNPNAAVARQSETSLTNWVDVNQQVQGEQEEMINLMNPMRQEDNQAKIDGMVVNNPNCRDEGILSTSNDYHPLGREFDGFDLNPIGNRQGPTTTVVGPNRPHQRTNIAGNIGWNSLELESFNPTSNDVILNRFSTDDEQQQQSEQQQPRMMVVVGGEGVAAPHRRTNEEKIGEEGEERQGGFIRMDNSRFSNRSQNERYQPEIYYEPSHKAQNHHTHDGDGQRLHHLHHLNQNRMVEGATSNINQMGYHEHEHQNTPNSLNHLFQPSHSQHSGNRTGTGLNSIDQSHNVQLQPIGIHSHPPPHQIVQQHLEQQHQGGHIGNNSGLQSNIYERYS